MFQSSSEKTARDAVLHHVAEITAELRETPPFEQMSEAHVLELVRHAKLSFHPAGETLVTPQQAASSILRVIRQGFVQAQRTHSKETELFTLGPGDCIAMGALIQHRPTRAQYVVLEDTFCLQIPRDIFMRVYEQSPELQRYAQEKLSILIDQASQQTQLRQLAYLGEHFSLNTALESLCQGTPVTAQPQETVVDGVRSMHQHNVGSVVICEERRPKGIFTLRDLRAEVAEEQLNLHVPLKSVMSSPVIALPKTASAFEAALVMAKNSISHLCVLDGELLHGVVSERDLFALQRINLVHLVRSLREANTLDEIISHRAPLQELIDSMLAYRASAGQITQLITLINDHSVQRVIELAKQRFPSDLPEFSWLCFGSEARQEQTLHTDQDNGVLFEARDEADAASKRTRLLPLMKSINQDLARCGFSLCPGNIMASNPELCLSTEEWMNKIRRALYKPTPEALLDATIFFDWRVLYGDTPATQAVQQQWLAALEDSPLFLRYMTANALRHRPPVGRFRDFSTPRTGDLKGLLDLKKQASTPFVDGARILSLAAGIAISNTRERFLELGKRGLLPQDQSQALAQAYEFIQQLRLQLHQKQMREGEPLTNLLPLEDLHPLDRRILREALRQAQELQSLLQHRYKL